MADSDKQILITPNVSQTAQPEIKFVGKDNSPLYIKVLDDNSLSFEGTQGQVFSISPTMSSGDIFSVNDISGIQSIAVNADGNITMDAQSQSVTMKNSGSNTATLILENTNNDANSGPILELFRNPADNTVSSGDLIGKIAFKGHFYDGSDYDQTKEWASITSEIEHYQGDGSVSFNVLQNGSSTAYLKVNGNAQDIVFNDGSSNDFDVRIESDNDANNFFSDGSAGRIGIGTNAPAAKLHVDAGATVAPSLTFGATAGQILQNENSEFAFGLDNDSPYSLWIQGRNSGNAARDISLQPLGGKIGIGTEAPAKTLDVAGDIGLTGDIYVAQNKKIYFDSTDSYIYADTDTSEDLHIGADGHIELEPDNDLLIKTGSTEKMRVTSAGNVGIGISSPVPKLHVYANNSTTDQTTSGAASITIEQDGTGDAALNFLLTGTRRWIMGIDNSLTDKFVLSTGGTDLNTGAKLTVDTGGNLTMAGGVNGTSASFTGTLSVSNTAVINGSHSFVDASAITLNGATINGTNHTRCLASANTYSFSNGYDLVGNLANGAELELFRFNVTDTNRRQFQAGKMYIRVQDIATSGFFQETVTFGYSGTDVFSSATDRIDSSMGGGNNAYDHEKATIVVEFTSTYICVKFKNDTGSQINAGANGWHASLSCELFEMDALQS